MPGSPSRIAAPLLIALALASCLGGAPERGARTRAPERPRLPGIDSPLIRQCLIDLRNQGVAFRPLTDRVFDEACSATGAVQLLDVGVPVANLGAMRCPLARAFAAWVRYAVRPAARLHLGAEVVKIESFGTYSCRNVAGTRLRSEHATANAVDIAAFVLDDGRRITVEQGWRSDDPGVRAFLRTIHRSACRRFGTVLSPDFNTAHADHLHLDLGPGPFCR